MVRLDLKSMRQARGKLAQHIQSAAESGWDFSTRWMGTKTYGRLIFSRTQINILASLGPGDDVMAALRTTEIIPVDLNAILTKNVQVLCDMIKVVDGASEGCETGQTK